MYVDIYNSWWKNNNDIVYDYWVKFRATASRDGNSRYGSDGNGLEISPDLSTDFVADTIYSNSNANLYKRYSSKDYKINYVCFAIPQFATTLELHDKGGLNNAERYSSEYTVPLESTEYDLLMVSGDDSNKQSITAVKAPFDQVKTIYFKVTGSDWSSYASSIRAAFYGIAGYNSSQNYIAYSNITSDSKGVLGTQIISGGDTYLSFEVPDYATHIAFNYGNSESNNTNLVMINPNGERTYTYTSSELAPVASPTISKIGGETTASSSTARLFVSNTVLDDFISTSSVWYGTNLTSNFAIQVWNDDCLGPTGDASSNSSYIYYFSNRFDGGGTSSTGTATNNYYYYVDIPTNMKYFRLLKMTATGRLTTSTIEYGCSYTGELDDTAYTYIYSIFNLDYTFHELASFEKDIMYFEEEIKSETYTFGDYHVGTQFMINLLQAYDSCSPSCFNGYGSASQLVNHLYSNPTAATRAQLVQTIEVYSSSKAGLYSPQSVGNILTEMVNRQGNQSNIASQIRVGSGLFQRSDDDYLVVTVVIVLSSISLIGLTIISTLVVRKKRKEQ